MYYRVGLLTFIPVSCHTNFGHFLTAEDLRRQISLCRAVRFKNKFGLRVRVDLSVKR